MQGEMGFAHPPLGHPPCDALKGRSLPRGGQHVCMAGKSMLPCYYFFSFKKWGLQPQGGNQCQQISVLSKSQPWERGFSVP